ncbi:hypothetical protein [Desulfosporosinus sp. SB140]|uniref:hypothetical protein n=1 Tax=Desulfosporosinus paludis TaxID=3115649 RepID=UPI003890C04A
MITKSWFYKKNSEKDHKNSKIMFLKDVRKTQNKSISKKEILLNIIQNRRNHNEIKAIRAVEDCRRLISVELNKFFNQIEHDSASSIFLVNNLRILVEETEAIILNCLKRCFNQTMGWKLREFNYVNWIYDIYTPISNYQETKQRTVFITTVVEAVARKTLSDSIDSLLKNSFLISLLDIDVSTLILPFLGIDSGAETLEFNHEICKRIAGALYSLKVRLSREINKEIANVFYATHDILDAKLEHKINLLEIELEKEDLYRSQLMEA